MQRKKTILGAALAASLMVFGSAAHAQGHANGRYGAWGDLDRDGIQNRYDRDRDGDGIANAQDPNPDVRTVRIARVDPMSPRGDLDRDGIQNRYDRDIDGDRVPNFRDRAPYNRHRA